MAKWIQSQFHPKNPNKCINSRMGKVIQSRSSWEAYFMRWLDTNPGVLEWGSEIFTIPYVNPLTGRNANYYPDFIIKYIDKTGQQFIKVIEIKPASQHAAKLMEKGNKHDKAARLQNAAKWTAATKYCQKAGIAFEVITENELFKKH